MEQSVVANIVGLVIGAAVTLALLFWIVRLAILSALAEDRRRVERAADVADRLSALNARVSPRTDADGL